MYFDLSLISSFPDFRFKINNINVAVLYILIVLNTIYNLFFNIYQNTNDKPNFNTTKCRYEIINPLDSQLKTLFKIQLFNPSFLISYNPFLISFKNRN